MAASRVTPRTLVLAAAAVAALVVLVAIWPRGTADTTRSSPQAPPRDARAGQVDPAVPPALGLEEMEAERSVPANRRDLFRFGAATPEPAEGAGPGGQTPQGQPGGGRTGAAPPQPDLPVLPPPPPPIPLRFVGLAETAKGKVASLSDGKFVYNAREGDVIEGRWRIVKIGTESLVIERVDGTGRQTLRGPGGN
ncbi:MAG TPA: hypothetical protein VMN81_03160 [Vicinamibacterales bacterium]|nr:hypothetical protein [Vicinamibacterales bacterium]